MKVCGAMGDDARGAEYLNQVALVPTNEENQLVTSRATKVDPGYLVELAKEVSIANTTVKAGACSKLEIIAQQIRFLQEQARQVLLDASTDEMITKASCNFVKKPGKIYHLYKKPDGKPYMGMLSPEEWGGTPPDEFLGSYKLEYDMTFTPLEKLEKRRAEMSRVQELFGERHKVPDHEPHIDITRHGGRPEVKDFINRPRIEHSSVQQKMEAAAASSSSTRRHNCSQTPIYRDNQGKEFFPVYSGKFILPVNWGPTVQVLH
eukprot:sb/3468407/